MKIYVRLKSGKSISFDVEPKTTIEELKILIQKSEGLNAKYQKLLFDGNNLCDSQTINDYAIKEEDTIICLFVLQEKNEEITLIIHYWRPENLTVNVLPNIKVKDLKVLISGKIGVEPNTLNLFFELKLLDENRTLKEEQLQTCCNISCVAKAIGGLGLEVKGPSIEEIKKGEKRNFGSGHPLLAIKFGFSIVGNCNNELCSLAKTSDKRVAKTIGFGCWQMNDITTYDSKCPLCNKLFEPDEFAFYNCFYNIFGTKKDINNTVIPFDQEIEEAPKDGYFSIKTQDLDKKLSETEEKKFKADHSWTMLRVIAAKSKTEIENDKDYEKFCEASFK